MPELLLVLTPLGLQIFTSSTLPYSFFYQGVNLDSFIPEANCSFLGISKYDIYIENGILIGQN